MSCKKETQNSAIIASGDYVAFAWNDLGMHCLNPTYDELVILPPYNTVNVRVLKRGNPPTVVTDGITVEYSILDNTYSFGKREYGGFWTYFRALFSGTPPAHDVGLAGTKLAGVMAVNNDHFTALGMSVVPGNDAGLWDPYQVININVKDASGTIVATTQATVPTSDEINCAKCHIDSKRTVFANILQKHDSIHGTSLYNNKPVLCVSCHGSPVLGSNAPRSLGKYLSQAIHGFHFTKNANCYDCLPVATTKCSRSLAHMGTADDGNCITCHGDIANVANTIASGTRIPWVNEPKYVSGLTGVDGVETNAVFYGDPNSHGNVYCTACQGSPRAMYPSLEAQDNYQPNQYQGSKIKSIESCGVCHNSSRGNGAGGEFAGTQGGTNPETKNACYVSHTAIFTNTASWLHAYK